MPIRTIRNALSPSPILDQVLNGAHLQTPFAAKLQTSVSPHHAGLRALRSARNLLTIIDHFTDDADGRLACQSTEIDSGFGVAGSCEHAAVSRAEGKDVAGSAEVFRLDFGACQRSAGECSVVGGDAGR